MMCLGLVFLFFFIYWYWTDYLEYAYNQETNVFSSECFSCITLWILSFFFSPPFFLFFLDFLLRKYFIFSTSFLFIYFPFLYLFDIFSGKFPCLYLSLSTKLSFWQSYSYFIVALCCFGFSFSQHSAPVL